MKIYFIGKTEVNLFPLRSNGLQGMPGKAGGSAFERRVKNDFDNGVGGELIEFADRLRYESFDLSEGTAANGPYLQNIIRLGRESALEHVSVTFYVAGVSRNLSHELAQHRHLSFSELSQRHVDMGDANVITPPAFRSKYTAGVAPLPRAHRERYEASVAYLKEDGLTRKQAREAARYGLPQGVETKFVVSGNLRAWRDVLKERLGVHADTEMQAFANQVACILGDEYPGVFDDIEYQSE